MVPHPMREPGAADDTSIPAASASRRHSPALRSRPPTVTSMLRSK